MGSLRNAPLWGSVHFVVMGLATALSGLVYSCDRNESAGPGVAHSTATVAADAAPYDPPPVLIVTAVDYEYAAAVGAVRGGRDDTMDGRQLSEGLVAQRPVVVIRAGWGKAQAAAAAAAAIDRYRPSLVIMAGVGGGLDNASVTSGDVVFVDGTFQYDLGKMTAGALEIWPPETPLEQAYPDKNFASSPALIAAAVSAARTTRFEPWALPAGCACEKDGTHKPVCTGPSEPVGREVPRVCAGTVGTGDAFVVDPLLAARLSASRGVVVVDMETAAVAEEAANHGLPFLGIRVVGDVVNGSNEDLYYCLKPMSGPRLRAVLERILPVIVGGGGETEAPLPCQQQGIASALPKHAAGLGDTGKTGRPVRVR